MKRRDFELHPSRNGCHLRREGGNHTIYTNAINGRSASVPRHGEVKMGTLKRICRDLDIPTPDR